MKVVQLITQMESGGAQRVAFLLSEALQCRGHETEIWFLYRKRPTYDHVRHVTVLANSRPPLRFVPRLLAELRVRLSQYAPDVLITHTYYANVLGQLNARRVGIRKRIAVQHTVAKDLPVLPKLLDCAIGSTNTYTANVAVSNTVVVSLSSYPSQYLKRLTIINNGIPCPIPTSNRRDTRYRWGLPSDAFLIANIGRLSSIKNQSVLLDVVARLSFTHLLLIGDGELRLELRDKAENLGIVDRVHMVGELAHEHVINLLAASDVFVFPSRSESMPVALIEAMMCGVPIVVSNIPATRELLGPDSAFFVAPDDDADIATAVRQVLANPVLAKRMCAQSAERGRNFTLEKMALEYERLFTAAD